MRRKPVCHYLKCWPEYFNEMWKGKKTADIRKNDRNFIVGDMVRLQEYKPDTKYYTQRYVEFKITHILEGIGLKKGYVMLSMGLFDKWKQ